LQGINYYQQAVNTKQPSLAINALARDAISLIGRKYPSNFLFALFPLAGVFFSMGKRNDIANSNHPEIRREWNIEKLTHRFKARSLGQESSQPALRQELGSLWRFVKDDLKLNYSTRPWKEIKQNIKDPRYWKQPQAALWSITAQTGLVAWMLAVLGLASKKRVFSNLARLGMLGSAMGNSATVSRGWQNRDGLDGKLILLGIPLGSFGELFSPRYNPRHYFLYGLTSIGGAMMVKGWDLNSKRYRAWVEEIVWLARLAKEHPELTAASVLKHFETTPHEAHLLRKRLGKYRYQYLINLLQTGQQQQTQKGISLAQFLSTADIQQ